VPTTAPASTWVQTSIDLGLPGDPVSAGHAGEATEPGYGQSDVRKLTGVTYRQLDHWDRAGIVTPSVCNAAGSGTRRRYSFRDILAIRVIKRLTDAGVSFRNLGRAVQTLRELGEADLASVVLVSDGESVYQCRSDDEVIDLVRGGQGVFVIAISHALAGLRSALVEPAPVADLTERLGRPATRRSPRARTSRTA
jgi:DNA-binding transcriptional MerR regulator